MMKSIAGKLLVLALCSLVSVTAAVAGGDMGWRKIQSISQRTCAPSKGLEVTLTTAHNNPDACLNSDTVEIACGLAIYKQMLAMVLTAQSADLEIRGFVDGCDADGQAQLQSMRLR